MTSVLFRQALNKQLLSRYSVPGNAHNFVERFERLRGLFESDIEAAYRRAIAASAGLQQIFSYNEPLPELSESGFIDALLIWTRKAMRAVTLVGEREIEFSKSISTLKVVYDSQNFTVDLDFPGFRSVRLRSIGASFFVSAHYRNAIGGEGAIGVSLVKPDVSIGPIAVAVLPGVRPWSPQAIPVSASGAMLYNVDPRGQWMGRINAVGFGGDGGVMTRLGLTQFLNLEFRVVATVDELDGAYWTTQDRA
jgi:hypothetical protein